MDPFDILGVAPNATIDICKKAYRRLAAKHHPDREGGDKTSFQNVQAAWDQIQGGYRRVSSHSQYSSFFNTGKKQEQSRSNGYQSEFFGGDPKKTYKNAARFSDIMDDFRRANNQGQRFTTVTIPFSTEDYVFSGAEYEYVIPAGTPQGWVGNITGTRNMVGNTGSNTINIRVALASDDPTMMVQGLDVENGRVPYAQNIGDMTCVVKTNALNLIMGAWIEVRDVFGKPHMIRLPAGFNPSQRLRVADAGYFLWNNERRLPILTSRGDLIVEIVPEFVAWEKMNENDRANAIKRMGE